MDGTLPLGNASLLIAPASGENLTRSGSVAVMDSNTSISYDEALPAGEYTLVSVTPEGGSGIYLGGRFTIGEESVCTEMEHWYAVFESFGGESAERPIRIAKPAHLSGLAATVNEGNDYAGFYFLQTADISLSEFSNWVGIGSAACRFAGVYDGGGKNVTGLTIASSGAESLDGVTCGHALFRHVGGTDADHRGRDPEPEGLRHGDGHGRICGRHCEPLRRFHPYQRLREFRDPERGCCWSGQYRRYRLYRCRR